MNKRWLIHTGFWLAYCVNDFSLEFAWAEASMKEVHDWDVFKLSMHSVLALLPVKIILSYFVLYVIIDKGLMRGKNLAGLILLFLPALFVTIVLHRAIVYYYIFPFVYHESVEGQTLLEVRRMLSALLDISFPVAWAVAMKLLRTYWTGKERVKSLEKEKLEAELKFLRNQTNPHFLFNTMNNIYALARKKSDLTAPVVMKLSKLLRFMLYESRKDTISIADEIKMIENYLELEKIRYNERLRINFELNIDHEGQEIAPLLLLPFIENAFKHGVSESRFESYINIKLNLLEGKLHYFIENSRDEDEKKTVQENIGLGNIRRQLELTYKEHNLMIDNRPDSFIVKLYINLNSHVALPLYHS